MIVSKYGKSYDTSNGSEQQSEIRDPGDAEDGGASAKQRWEDNGGPAKPARPAGGDVRPARKPIWSVQSLLEMARSVLRNRQSEERAHERGDSEDREQVKERADRLENQNVARAAAAERDRYRNAWENT
jgi:hypothetical protein